MFDLASNRTTSTNSGGRVRVTTTVHGTAGGFAQRVDLFGSSNDYRAYADGHRTGIPMASAGFSFQGRKGVGSSSQPQHQGYARSQQPANEPHWGADFDSNRFQDERSANRRRPSWDHDFTEAGGWEPSPASLNDPVAPIHRRGVNRKPSNHARRATSSTTDDSTNQQMRAKSYNASAQVKSSSIGSTPPTVGRHARRQGTRISPKTFANTSAPATKSFDVGSQQGRASTLVNKQTPTLCPQAQSIDSTESGFGKLLAKVIKELGLPRGSSLAAVVAASDELGLDVGRGPRIVQLRSLATQLGID
eukprot:SAG31_NODE_4523_length_3168_cov_1.746497_2_plen_305_part_00